MVCEEVAPEGDGNGDGYHDLGWVIEIDPATKSVINQDGTGGVDKLWAMGRQTHENVAIKADQTITYWGGDNITNGFLYKFVPATAGQYGSGTLYVLETSTALGTGTWKLIANTTVADRNNTIALSHAAGAYNFQRIEDVEIGPDGKIYFASTTTGRIYRFNDAGTTVNNLEVFVESSFFDVDGAGPGAPTRFETPDNLAFDGEGNLWVLQDGGNSHIWVVAPNHTSATPAIKIFANTPAGSEPTGITFSPDYKFMFLSIQHPNNTNTAQQTDAAGIPVVFDNSTTLVIARKENLGVTALPVKFVKLSLVQRSLGMEVKWTTSGSKDALTYEIERSVNGTHFTRIAKVTPTNRNISDFTFLDKEVPMGNTVYYRIKACELDNDCIYSDVKTSKLSNFKVLRAVPQIDGNSLRVLYNSDASTEISILLYTNDGRNVHSEKRSVNKGQNIFTLTTHRLPKGYYILKVVSNNNTESAGFTN